MSTSLLLFIAAIGALICGGLASTKHRSVATWAVLGACFPLIAGIAIACLPDKKHLAVALEEMPS